MTRPKRRRPKGSGCIERLPSGRVRGIYGRTRSPVMDDEAAVRAWIERQIAKRVMGEPALKPTKKLRELEAAYLAELGRRGCTASTINGKRSHLKATLELCGDLQIGRVDGPALKAIVAEMHRLGWHPSTVNNRINCVTGMLKMAMEDGLISPRLLPVRRPKVTVASRPDSYSEAEIRALIDAARTLEDPRYLAAVMLGAYAGLRPSEVLRVRREDLDARRRVLTIPVRSATDRPKSGKERQVPIPGVLVAALLACGAAPGQAIVNRSGWQYPGNLSRFLVPVWDAAGVSPGSKRLHRLRHYWATAFADGGASPFELMAAAGWSSWEMVKRYYHGVAKHGSKALKRWDNSSGIPRQAETSRKAP